MFQTPHAALALAAVLLAAALPAAARSAGVLALTFGADRAGIVAQASATFGAAPVLRRETGCRNGDFDLADWGKGLTLVFQGGRFVGWQAEPSIGPGYSTRAGIAFGKPVSEMRAANPGLILSDAVRGREFGFDGMWGQVLQPGRAATLDALRGGTWCSRR
jgi:hypothetical protein